MTTGLPTDVSDVFERFITTELTTVDARQQPITWPVTPYHAPDHGTIDVTTGLGYPKKADDARRHPRVALLFSDPTGSGISSGMRVLVQGIAEVDESDLDANADRYLRESGEKLPATKTMQPPGFMRNALRWYYARIYLRVRPERVLVWPHGDMAEPPQIHDSHLEEVRSGHSQEPAEPHAPAAGGETRWDARMDELGSRHSTAVLSWVGPDGFPLAARLPVAVDSAARRVRIEAAPTGLPLTAGRACLAAHAHAPDFTWQENFQVRGDLARTDSGWELVPHRMIGGFELPKGALRRYRDIARNHWRFYRSARRRERTGPPAV
jgi:hypothetical protein